MTVVYVILAVVIPIAAVLCLMKPSSRRLDTRFALNYAHRGLHDCEKPQNGSPRVPENSLSAFELAVDAGQGIELDIQLSRDGEVYVFHDYTLERMTGRAGKLAELTSDELDLLRLVGTDEPIPRLSKVLELVDGKVPLLIELKGESTDCALCPKADAILSHYKGGYVVESFNPMLLNWYKKHRPEIYRGQLYTNVCKVKNKVTPLNLALSAMLTNILSRPDFIAYDLRTPRLLPLFVTTRIFGAARFGWTARKPEEAVKDHVIFEGFLPERGR